MLHRIVMPSLLALEKQVAMLCVHEEGHVAGSSGQLQAHSQQGTIAHKD